VLGKSVIDAGAAGIAAGDVRRQAGSAKLDWNRRVGDGTRKRKTSCVALVVAVVVLTAGPAAGRTPTDDAQQRCHLNAQVIEAYQAGRHAKGLASPEEALQRRQLASSQSTCQEVVLMLATTSAGSVIRRLSGTVTLWPLNDGEARDFMVAFYRTWLAPAGRSDPAKALRQTRLSYLNSSDPTLRDPRVWAPYVLAE
jgi:hypothetical protein